MTERAAHPPGSATRLPAAADGSPETRPEPTRLARRALALIALGVLLRLGLWARVEAHPERLIQGDGVGYVQIARNLVEGRGFSMRREPPYVPDMLRTPGYPLFVAGIHAIAGHRPEVVTLVQNLLGLATLWIAYRAARRLFGRRTALIGAALMAVDVGAIILANVTLTETLFVLVLTLAMACLAASLGAPRERPWLAGAGACFGSATLIRPACIFLPLLLAPVLWPALRRGRLQRTLGVTILLGVHLLVLSCWSYRNWRVFGSPSIILSIQSQTLNTHASYLRAGLKGTTLAEEEPRLFEEARRELGDRAGDKARMDRLVHAKAAAEIRRRPGRYAWLYAKGMLLTLVLPNTNFLANILGILDRPTGLIADLRTRTPAASLRALADFSRRYLDGSPDRALLLAAGLVEAAVVIATLVAAAAGAWLGFRHGRGPAVVLLLAVIAYFVAIAGPIGTGRYRLPAMPSLMTLAGYGLASSLAARRSPGRAGKAPGYRPAG